MTEISSLTNAHVRHVVQLREKASLRRSEGVFLAEGARFVSEVPWERGEELYLTSQGRQLLADRNPELISLMEAKGQLYEVTDAVYGKMTEVEHPQGVLAVVRRQSYKKEALLMREAPLLLLLEGIQDPGNLGTIFRTAEAAGADGIILCGCTDIYGGKASRSTMGAVYRVPHIIAESAETAIAELQQNDVKVYAAALKGAGDFLLGDYRSGTAFIVGNEGRGLKEETIAAADGAVFIPMAGRAESLNAGVSAALLLYEAYRQRRS